MTANPRRMLDLARFLVRNGETVLLVDVLRMVLAVAPGDGRVAMLLSKTLAGQGRLDEAIAAGDAWIRRHGLAAELLEVLTRARVSRGDADADVTAVRTILTAPGRREGYQQLAGLRDRLPDKRPVVQLLHWASAWHGTDDPQAAVLLHNAFQVGRAAFDDHAGRLIRSRSDLLWARYLRAVIACCVDGLTPEPGDLAALAGEPAPAFRAASLACVTALAAAPVPTFGTRSALFDHCLSRLRDDGFGPDDLYLEFGVATGASTRAIAARLDGTLHAFDSFEGIPESWEHEAAGSYSTRGVIPELPPNVQVHVGWFDATIPQFDTGTPGRIAFVHVDCDLYSSTATVFDGLGDRLADRSILVFDEYVGYPGFERHEKLAFDEFLARTGWRSEVVAVGPFTKQVAFRIHRSRARA